MKVGIIGSGIVGQTIGAKLVSQGHEVVLGTRDPKQLDQPKGMAGMGAPLGQWLAEGGKGARLGTFADAARHGEIVVNATSGMISVDALNLAGKEHLKGKVLIDVSNDLDGSRGFPPATRATDAPESTVAVRLQKAFPDTHVVKALNTMSAFVMVAPQALAGGDHTVFIAGNDAASKAKVTSLLQSWGWKDVFDLGDVNTAPAPELLFAVWTRCFGVLGMRPFNFKVVR